MSATENITGPDPRESDTTEREYTVDITITITQRITSSNYELSDQEERIANAIYKMLSAGGFHHTESEVAIDFTPR